MECVAHRAVYEADHELDGGLHLAGPPGRRGLCDFAEYVDEDDAEHQRKEHRVDVQRVEVALAVAADGPRPIHLADGQVLEMVGDVLASRMPGCRHDRLNVSRRTATPPAGPGASRCTRRTGTPGAAASRSRTRR